MQIILYGGAWSFFIGIFGGILNTIVFLSLQTFRQNSCAFYLTIMSIVNLGQLSMQVYYPVLLSLVLELIEHKCHYFIVNFDILFFNSVHFFDLSIATIDQYLATCSCPYWQQSIFLNK
jgi:hypothetical protein